MQVVAEQQKRLAADNGAVADACGDSFGHWRHLHHQAVAQCLIRLSFLPLGSQMTLEPTPAFPVSSLSPIWGRSMTPALWKGTPRAWPGAAPAQRVAGMWRVEVTGAFAALPVPRRPTVLKAGPTFQQAAICWTPSRATWRRPRTSAWQGEPPSLT